MNRDLANADLSKAKTEAKNLKDANRDNEKTQLEVIEGLRTNYEQAKRKRRTEKSKLSNAKKQRT